MLDGKIKAIAKKNVVQAKKFSEMLEASVIQYEKRSLETVEVIKALVDMAKDMKSWDYQTMNWHFMMQFRPMNLLEISMKMMS